MEIKESSNASIIAIFSLIIVFLIIIFYIIYSNSISEHDKELQEVYNKAYQDGYLKGKEDGAYQVLELRHNADSIMWKDLQTKNKW